MWRHIINTAIKTRQNTKVNGFQKLREVKKLVLQREENLTIVEGGKLDFFRLELGYV
jgi:hypothetical protein